MEFEPVEKDGKLGVKVIGEEIEALMERVEEGIVKMTGQAECGLFAGDFLSRPDEGCYLIMDHECQGEIDDQCLVKQFLAELGGEDIHTSWSV